MNDAPKSILIVDDDTDLRALLQEYLARYGFVIHTVGDGREMDEWLATHQPDLIILDLMLPGEDGLSLAQRLRRRGNQPILILSARGDDIDRIIGLEIGADDYLPKPFNPRELLARIKSLLRRAGPFVEAPSSEAAPPQPEGRSTLGFAGYVLDEIKQQLVSDGGTIALTDAECSLLRVLLENCNREVSRDQLMQQLKGFERDPFNRTIDVSINRLRKKIEPDPAHPVYIRTVWGKGYVFTHCGPRA